VCVWKCASRERRQLHFHTFIAGEEFSANGANVIIAQLFARCLYVHAFVYKKRLAHCFHWQNFCPKEDSGKSELAGDYEQIVGSFYAFYYSLFSIIFTALSNNVSSIAVGRISDKINKLFNPSHLKAFYF
jgi:hypothetical protein